ncbi:MAG: hypothetical protein AAB391_01395 [Patescibacteria group bacterium]
MRTFLLFTAAFLACFAHTPLTQSVCGATLSVSTTGPAYQTFVPGSPQGTYLAVTLSASAEEDVRMSALPLMLTVANSAMPTQLSNMRLWDGTVALNTGANTLNPASTGTNTTTFDQSLVIPKGTTKTLLLKGSVSSSAAGTFRWSLGSGLIATGITSSQLASISIDTAANLSTTMYGSLGTHPAITSFTPQLGGIAVIYQVNGVAGLPFAIYASSDLVNWTRRASLTFGASGQFVLWDFPDAQRQFYKAVTEWPSRLAISTSSTSPRYKIASGGATNVTMAAYTVRTEYEAVNLDRIGLRLTQGSASDLGQVTVWDGTNQIGSTVFVGGNVYAVCTFASPLLIPKDGERTLTIKADVENILFIGGYGVVGPSGHLIAIDYDDSNLQRTVGTGVESGQTITASGTTAVAGVRIFKSHPSFAIDQLPGTGVADERLLRFKVTADTAGSASLHKLSFFVEAIGASMWNMNLYAYEDSSYSIPVSGVGAGGKVSNTNFFAGLVEVRAQTSTGAASAIVIPAGQTRYFELRSSVLNQSSTTVVYARLLSDDYWPQGPTIDASLDSALFLDQYSFHKNILWSPDTLGPVQPGTSFDWTNGYGLPGLMPATIVQVRTP